jgi:hypothetical protein
MSLRGSLLNSLDMGPNWTNSWLPLEGHVILLHFKNVNILINIVWEVHFLKPILTKDDKFTFEIKYFSNYENPFVFQSEIKL